MIDKELANELHEQLLSDRLRLEGEISNLAVKGVRSGPFQPDESDAYDQHPADQGSELFEREKNLTLERTLQVELQDVNNALQRFDDGSYGTCEACGKPIGEKRLRAIPSAALCIEDQEKLERQRAAVPPRG